MFAGFPVHHMTDNVRVRWIQGRTLLRPRDRKGTIIRKTKNSSFKNEKSKKEVDVTITVSNKDIV